MAFARLLRAAESASNESNYLATLSLTAWEMPTILSQARRAEQGSAGADEKSSDAPSAIGRDYDSLRKSLLKESGRDLGSMITKANQVHLELNDALANIRLIASVTATDRAIGLSGAATELLQLSYPLDKEALGQLRDKYNDARKRFVETSLEDLK